MWVLDSEGGAPQPLGPEGATARRRGCISPDGKLVAARDPENRLTIYPVSGGKPIPVPNTQPGEEPVQWNSDGRARYWWASARPLPQVSEINLATGERKLFGTFIPADPTGLFGNTAPSFSRDLKSYV